MNMPTTAQRLSELLPFTRALATADRLNPGVLFDEYAPTEEDQTRPYHDEIEGWKKGLKCYTGFKDVLFITSVCAFFNNRSQAGEVAWQRKAGY